MLLYRRPGVSALGNDLAYWCFVKTRNNACGSNKKPDPLTRRAGLCQLAKDVAIEALRERRPNSTLDRIRCSYSEPFCAT